MSSFELLPNIQMHLIINIVIILFSISVVFYHKIETEEQNDLLLSFPRRRLEENF